MIYVEVFKLSDTVDIKLMISKCDILSCKSHEIFNPLFAYRPNDINNKSNVYLLSFYYHSLRLD